MGDRAIMLYVRTNITRPASWIRRIVHGGDQAVGKTLHRIDAAKGRRVLGGGILAVKQGNPFMASHGFHPVVQMVTTDAEQQG